MSNNNIARKCNETRPHTTKSENQVDKSVDVPTHCPQSWSIYSDHEPQHTNGNPIRDYSLEGFSARLVVVKHVTVEGKA